jgi:hypothetical protein
MGVEKVNFILLKKIFFIRAKNTCIVLSCNNMHRVNRNRPQIVQTNTVWNKMIYI